MLTDNSVYLLIGKKNKNEIYLYEIDDNFLLPVQKSHLEKIPTYTLFAFNKCLIAMIIVHSTNEVKNLLNILQYDYISIKNTKYNYILSKPIDSDVKGYITYFYGLIRTTEKNDNNLLIFI